MDWSGKFWIGVFSEADGTPSFSRVASAIVTIVALFWVSGIVIYDIRRHDKPELPDFMGLIAFLGIFYGINKLSNALKREQP